MHDSFGWGATMTDETHKSKVSSEQLQEKKQQIAKALIEAMRNHPPSKQDMYLVLNKMKEAFPELEALRGPMAKLPGEISVQWFLMLPIYDIFRTVERKLKKKPLHPERAKDAFAHLLWLATKLLFMDDLLILAEQKVVEKGEWTMRQLRAEQIQGHIRIANALFRKTTGSKDVFIFREDVPDFFTRLPTPCRGSDDFLGRVQSLASIFEVRLKPLRALVLTTDRSLGSIKLVEKWLEEKGVSQYAGIISTWKNIRRVRKIPPIHAGISVEVLDAIEFFGERFPVNFSQLWDSILDKFLESLVKFQEILSDLQTS